MTATAQARVRDEGAGWWYGVRVLGGGAGARLLVRGRLLRCGLGGGLGGGGGLLCFPRRLLGRLARLVFRKRTSILLLLLLPHQPIGDALVLLCPRGDEQWLERAQHALERGDHALLVEGARPLH